MTELDQSNTDGSDSDYMPADMAPMGLEDVGSIVLALALLGTFALILGAAMLAKWLLGMA